MEINQSDDVIAKLFKAMSNGADNVNELFQRYDEYSCSIKPYLTAPTFAFASESWHYDLEDHRCLHDSWVDSLDIIETHSLEPSNERKIDLALRLLGAYHDGQTLIRYRNVRSYNLTLKDSLRRQTQVGHGDWLIDAVSLTEQKTVRHEIIFSEGGYWRIECDEIEHQWIPDNIAT